MSSVSKATIENKATSVTTHFKEINNMFIVSVIAKSSPAQRMCERHFRPIKRATASKLGKM